MNSLDFNQEKLFRKKKISHIPSCQIETVVGQMARFAFVSGAATELVRDEKRELKGRNLEEIGRR